ncbi:MAG TPA: hypothetical protein VKG78_02975 [Opitutaceae bacterium]|nr:hypothetical protein [Opitutaceae bacterium]
MPHDPNAQFDQTVLEMIEHSPGGSVPATPTYQDALARLHASHQVYAHADHKDGHVTVRSLAGAPRFHAGNLEALAAGWPDAGALESNASVFDRYVGSLPAALRGNAESHRARVVGRSVLHRAKHAGGEKLPVAHDLMHTLFLVPGAGPHPGLPGNYLHGCLLQAGPDGAPGSWAVQIHDRDDGAAVVSAPTMRAAMEKLQEVLECAPFHMEELGALGFRLV